MAGQAMAMTGKTMTGKTMTGRGAKAVNAARHDGSDRAGARVLNGAFPEGLVWHVMCAAPGREGVFVLDGTRHGLVCYAPAERVVLRRKLRGGVVRPVVTDRLIFPRYVFVASRDAAPDFAAIEARHGAGRMLRVGRVPVVLPERAVRAFWEEEERGGFDATLRVAEALRRRSQRLAPGRAVTLVAGPFAGLRATVARHGRADRIFVLIEMFGGPSRAEVGLDDIGEAV